MIRSGKQYLAEMGSREEGLPLEEELSPAEKRRLQKQKEAEERRQRRKKEALEQEIGQLETEIAGLEEQLGRQDVMTDPAKLQSIADSLEKSRQRLDEAYEKWLELQD